MMRTNNLDLPYIAEAQAQKHVTHNDAIRRLDALVQLSVVSRVIADPPDVPAEGERYIIAADATGVWAGEEGRLAAWQDGAWAFFMPRRGWQAYVEDEDAAVVYNGSAWEALNGAASVNPASVVGVNTTADATNKLAVKSDAALFSHDDVTPGSGDIRMVVNKAVDTNTASVLFQTAFSGRAEFGLTGSDDFVIRVSEDGVTFRDAIVVDRTTGAVTFPNTADGVIAPPGTPAVTSDTLSHDRATFSWTPGTGPAPETYEAQIREQGAPAWTSLALDPADATSVTVTDLVEGTDYEFRVRAGASSTFGDWSSIAAISTLRFDLYVNPGHPAASDSNDGSQAAPLATLTALRSVLDAYSDAAVLTAWVAGETYADDHLSLGTLAGPAEVTFAPGARLSWTPGVGGSALQAGSNSAGHLTIYGNGVIVEDFDTGTGNGIGSDGATMIAYDVDVRRCVDGTSAHGGAYLEVHRCSFTDCTKATAAHIETTETLHVDCYFKPASGGKLLEQNGSGGATFRRCTFAPASGEPSSFSGAAQATFEQCVLGTLTEPLLYTGITGAFSLTDCFVNMHGDGHQTLSLTRCYGLFTQRLRDGTDVSTSIERCVFAGTSEAADRFIYSLQSGSLGVNDITVSNSIITGYGAGVVLFNDTLGALWDAAEASVDRCAFFGNATDFDAEATERIGTSITNISTTDCLTGPADSLDMADYASDDTDFGFAEADAKTTGCPDAVADMAS